MWNVQIRDVIVATGETLDDEAGIKSHAAAEAWLAANRPELEIDNWRHSYAGATSKGPPQ